MTTPPDFRAELQLLLDSAEANSSAIGGPRTSAWLASMCRARAALDALPSTPDFRALLDEVTHAAEYHVSPYPGCEDAWEDLICRINAALEAVPAATPTSTDLAELISWLIEESIQAANSDAPVAAGKLEYAAHLLGRDLDDGATPAPAPVAERDTPPRNPTTEELQTIARLFGLEVNDWAALSWVVVTCMSAYADAPLPEVQP